MNLKLDSAYRSLFDRFSSRAVDPGSFALVRPGRPFPNPETCLRIQCGNISQEQAGVDLLADCAFAGFQGSQSCADPLCAPYCGETARTVARGSVFPLPVSPRVDALFLDGPPAGCDPVYSGDHFSGPYDDPGFLCGCSGPGGWVNDNPLLAVALVAAASYGVYRWRAGR
jgi:hypothetical protein